MASYPMLEKGLVCKTCLTWVRFPPMSPCSRSPTGSGNTFRSCKVWVRIPPRVPPLLSQLAVEADLDSVCWGFESLRGDHLCFCRQTGYSRLPLKEEPVGSSPTRSAILREPGEVVRFYRDAKASVKLSGGNTWSVGEMTELANVSAWKVDGGKPRARSGRALSAKQWPEFRGSVTLKGRERPRKSLVAGNRVGLQDTPLPPFQWRIVRVVY